MEDKTDPDGNGLFLLNLLTSNFTVCTGLAVLLLLFAFFSGLFHALEVALKRTVKKRTPQQQPLNDKLRHLIAKPKRLAETLEIVQVFLKLCIAFTISIISWLFLQEEHVLLILSVAFASCFLIIVAGRYAVKLIPPNNNILSNPIITNVLFLLYFIFYPIASLKASINKASRKMLLKKGYISGRSATVIDNGLFKGVENFNTTTVKQVMRFRMDITAFDMDLDFQELLHNINKFGFSRVPVYRDTIDRIEGILYLKDLLPYIGRDKNFPWQNLLRPAYFVPEGKKIEELLKEFQEKHIHIALVVDGYGGISGLITLEDILEEIVGEINDELDEVDLAYVQLDDSTYIFEGKTSLNDFSRIVEVEASLFDEVKGESESLGGLLLQINSNLPKKGDEIIFRNFVFKIDSANNKRVKKVRVHIIEEKHVSNAD